MMSNDDDREAVARALRALPELAPPADGWARIARRLGRSPANARPGSARPAVAFAIAAGTLAFVALALWPGRDRAPREAPAPAVTDLAAGAAEPDLAARSAGLERLLDALPPARVARASTALTTALLEDRIALVDERLSATAGEALPPAATQALLRERVVLLDSLVRVRYAASVGQTL
jgi:hypothetical protein